MAKGIRKGLTFEFLFQWYFGFTYFGSPTTTIDIVIFKKNIIHISFYKVFKCSYFFRLYG